MPIVANIEVQGCWRDVNRIGVPPYMGVYFVYTGSYNSNTNLVALCRLLYVGQSVNVNERVQDHEGRQAWARFLEPGEELIYAFAAVMSSYLDDVEAALIYRLQPPCNDVLKDAYCKRPLHLTIHAHPAYRLPSVLSLP